MTEEARKLRLRSNEKRYRQTEKGRLVQRAASAKWYQSEKGKARSREYYAKMYADPQRRARHLARCRQYQANLNKKERLEKHYRWLAETETGQRFKKLNSLGLPANAPDSLIHAAELLRALKQELIK